MLLLIRSEDAKSRLLDGWYDGSRRGAPGTTIKVWGNGAANWDGYRVCLRLQSVGGGRAIWQSRAGGPKREIEGTALIWRGRISRTFPLQVAERASVPANFVFSMCTAFLRELLRCLGWLDWTMVNDGREPASLQIARQGCQGPIITVHQAGQRVLVRAGGLDRSAVDGLPGANPRLRTAKICSGPFGVEGQSLVWKLCSKPWKKASVLAVWGPQGLHVGRRLRGPTSSLRGDR